MTYRVAIIGCGRMACTIDDEVVGKLSRSGMLLPYCHAGGYAAVDETEMVAASDIDPERLRDAQERWHIPRGYIDYRELIAREQPDLISVTTRPENHAEIIVYAAEHGVKGMFVEKPLCCSLAETDSIREACERNDVQLEFGPMRRNWAVYQQARELATSGQFGEVQAALGFSGNPCGGHTLDNLLYLLGDPDPVTLQATLGKLSPFEGDTTDSRFKPDAPIQTAHVTFADDTAIYISGAGIRAEYEVVCTDGTIRILADGYALYARRYDESTRGYEEVPIPPVERWSSAVAKVRDLAEAVRTGQPGVSNLRATLVGQEIGFAMYESHLRGGAPVDIPIGNRERWVSSW
ncbi:MAG: hypothetical protein CMN65_07580 [Sphingomonadaceae bacterium]|nr:hypothetical protein [Sphingomonadaceae bacterium]